MEDLSKSQIVLLLILVSVVVSFTTAIVTAALLEQTPIGVTNTVQKVIERAVGTDSGGTQKETVEVITQESQVMSVVKNVSDAVVSIVASKDLPVVERCVISPFGDDDVFGQLFPEFQIPQLCERGTQKRQVSAGSGFVIQDNGLIVTNRHVVEDAEAEYTAIFKNGKKLTAKVVARDPVQDVAIMKVDAKNLPAVSLGDSSTLQIGQTVIAIGNALGEFQNTVSVGVISGLQRSIVASGESLRSVIQTDAAINPGNSGGPLLDLSGKVIGVNSAVAAGAQNIGFALPINVIKRDVARVEQKGSIVYPFLGVRYQMIDEDLQKEKKLSVSEGALIAGSDNATAVTPGSPAANAGLRAGDIIVKLGGEKVTTSNSLAELIEKHEVGDTVSITFLRDGKEATLQLVLTARK